eukprot:2112578-Prorocentrum_lima.AAC.1
MARKHGWGHGVGTVIACDWWLLQHKDRDLPIGPGFGSNVKQDRQWACLGCGEKYTSAIDNLYRLL